METENAQVSRRAYGFCSDPDYAVIFIMFARLDTELYSFLLRSVAVTLFASAMRKCFALFKQL